MKKKVVLAVLLGVILVVAAVVLIRWATDEYAVRPVAGRLSFEREALLPQDYMVGSFIVRWDSEGGGTLSICNRANPDKLLWCSLPGASFIAAARGIESVTESRGSYNIKDSLASVCSDQTIESIECQDGVLKIRGMLSGGTENTPYTVTLTETSPADESPDVRAVNRWEVKWHLNDLLQVIAAHNGYGTARHSGKVLVLDADALLNDIAL